MTDILSALKEVRLGLLLAVLTLVYGFGLGMTFGIAEDGIKGHLKAEGQAALETKYEGDEAGMKAVVSKSWVYFKRAHLHANGLGATAVGLILLLAFLEPKKAMKSITATVIGVGSLGYSLFWMLAGLAAPGAGGTGAAKEGLTWLAWPTSFFCMVGLLLTLYVVIKALFGRS